MPLTDLPGAQTVFCRAVSLGSLARAAKLLNIEPASASEYVTQLEHFLGRKLLERTHRGCRPTTQGEVFFERWRTQIDQLQSLAAHLNPSSEHAGGYLRMAFPSTTGATLLLPLLGEFAAEHPEIEFDVQFTHGSYHPLWDGTDLRIVHADYRRELVRQIPLGSVRRTIVASALYLQTHEPVRTPEDLRRPEIFGARDTAEKGFLTLRSTAGETHIRVHPQICVRNHIAALEAARHNLGIAVSVPVYLSKPWLDSGELVTILPEWKPTSLPLRAIVSLDRKPHPAIEAFIERLRAYFAKFEEPL